jgi:hypothetical protein
MHHSACASGGILTFSTAPLPGDVHLLTPVITDPAVRHAPRTPARIRSHSLSLPPPPRRTMALGVESYALNRDLSSM